MESFAVLAISTLGTLLWLISLWEWRHDPVRAPLLMVIGFLGIGYWTGSLTYAGLLSSEHARVVATTVRVVMLISGAVYLFTNRRVRA